MVLVEYIVFEYVRNIQNVFNLEFMGTFWSHDASDPNVITMSSLGKRSFVPSERDGLGGEQGVGLAMVLDAVMVDGRGVSSDS